MRPRLGGITRMISPGSRFDSSLFFRKAYLGDGSGKPFLRNLPASLPLAPHLISSPSRDGGLLH